MASKCPHKETTTGSNRAGVEPPTLRLFDNTLRPNCYICQSFPCLLDLTKKDRRQHNVFHCGTDTEGERSPAAGTNCTQPDNLYRPTLCIQLPQVSHWQSNKQWCVTTKGPWVPLHTSPGLFLTRLQVAFVFCVPLRRPASLVVCKL